MRTTLSIDDDVLEAARGLAAAQRKSIGEVITSLARRSLRPAEPLLATRNGIPQLPIREGSRPVTLELVNQMRDELL